MAVMQEATRRATTPTAAPRDLEPPSRPIRSLWIDIGLLVLLVLGLAAATPLDSAFTVDEGSYALQADALADGSWDIPYRFEAADPDGEWFPYLNGATTEAGGHVAIYRQPAYPLVQSWLVAAVGPTLGLHLLPMLGVIATAVVAWLLAGELLGGGQRIAFWLAALSPVLFNGLVVWAHAPVAALAGLAALAAVRLLRPHAPPTATAAALLTAALVAVAALRSEGVLFAGGLVAAAGWGALRRGGWRRAAWFAPAGVAAVAAFAASRSWTAAIAGHAASAPSGSGSSGGFMAGRVDGAWHTIAAGGTGTSRGASLLVLLAAALALAAAYALRRGGDRYVRDAAVLVVIAAVLFAVRTAVATDDFVTGLLTAWPIVLLAGPVRRTEERSTAERALLAGAALFTLGVVGTQYAQGGGLEWGGRFLSPLLVPLAVVCAAGIMRIGALVGAQPTAVRRLAVMGIAGLVVVPAFSGIVAGNRVRSFHDGLVSDIERAQVDVVVAVGERALPRVAWRTADDVDWLLVGDERDLRRALAALDADLPGQIAIYSAQPPTVAGWHVTASTGNLHEVDRAS